MKNFINRCLDEGSRILDSQMLASCPVPVVYRPWEIGCFLSIPNNPVVMTSEHYGLFIPVTVLFPDGYRTTDKLFLTTFTKSVRLKDRCVFANGTASQFVKQFAHWGEAVKALAGKVIEVASIANCEISSPVGMVRNTRVYGLDLR